jgi:hypothetical protein
MTKMKLTKAQAAHLNRLRKQYTRVAKIGGAWNTYLRIDHQEFCVVDGTYYARARWYSRMLAVALARLLEAQKVSLKNS